MLHPYTIKSICLFLFVLLVSCNEQPTDPGKKDAILQIISITADQQPLRFNEMNDGVEIDATFRIRFSTAVDSTTVNTGILLKNIENDQLQELTINYDLNDQTLFIQPIDRLTASQEYELTITPELRGKAGESKTIEFTITEEMLSFYRQDMTYGPEVGRYKLMIGNSSNHLEEIEINFLKK